jgi:hypothetical protein
MKLTIALLSICAAAPLLADVTLRYHTDVKMNSMLPASGGEQAMQDRLARMGDGAIRLKNGKAWSSVGPWMSIVDYNTQQITFIDQEHKTFANLPLAELPDKMSALMPQMGESVKKMMELIKPVVDSKKTGRTETIQGILTEEREIVMSIAMPAAAGGTNMKMVIQLWTAKPEEALRNQAVREFAGYSSASNYLLNPAGMIQKMMANLPGFGDAMKSVAAEVTRSNVMMLRTRTEIYIQFPPAMLKALAAQNPSAAAIDPNAPMMQTSQEAVEVSSAPIEDSTFQVPADYQPVVAADLLKVLIAEQMSPAGAPSKQ